MGDLAGVTRQHVLLAVRDEHEGLTPAGSEPGAGFSVAAPVFGADDRVTATLSVLVPEENADPRQLGPAVRTAARAVSRGHGARRAIGLGGAERSAEW